MFRSPSSRTLPGLHLKTFCSCYSQTPVPRCILSMSPVRHNNFPFKPETVWFVRRRCIIASIYRPYASCHSFIDSLIGTATVGPFWHPRLCPLISFPQCFFWDRWKRQGFGKAREVIIHSRIGWLWSGDSFYSGHTPTCLFNKIKSWWLLPLVLLASWLNGGSQ